jgi:hypothetical protein
MTNQIIISDPILGSLEATEYMLGVWVCLYFDPKGEYDGEGKGIGHNKKVVKFWAEAWNTLLSQAKDLGVVMFFCGPTSKSREKAYIAQGWEKDTVYELVYHVYSSDISNSHVDSIETPFWELPEDEYLWDGDEENTKEVDMEYLTPRQHVTATEAGFAEAWPLPIEDRIRISASLISSDIIVTPGNCPSTWHVSTRVSGTHRYDRIFHIYEQSVCALSPRYQEASILLAALY